MGLILLSLLWERSFYRDVLLIGSHSTQSAQEPKYVWRWGVKTYAELYEVMKAFTFDPAALACPILSIIGEKEYQQGPASRLQQTQVVDRNRDPRSKLSVTTAADGADAHAMSTNMSLMAQLVFDWLDDIVQEREPSTKLLLKGA